MAAFKDPWDWTVNEVVDEFCRSRTLWDDRPGSSLPEPSVLEQVLRENEINGSTLLTDVTQGVLKDDLSIKALGHRSAILYAIQKLRRTSPNYQAHAPENPSQQPAPSTYTPTPSQYLPHLGHAWNLQSPTSATSREPPRTPFIQKPDNVQPHQGTTILAAHANTASDTRIRRRETLVEDESGRKRRKLAPVPVDDAAIDGSVSQLFIADKPERIAAQKTPCPPLFPGDQVNFGDEHSYLGPKKLPVDQVFYGQTQFGKPVAEKYRQDLSTIYEGDTEFIVLPSHAPQGLQDYVYSQMRYFLNGPKRRELCREGKTGTIIFPYREGILRGNQPRSVTFFQTGNADDISVSRENALISNIDISYDDKSNHDWDFLAHWANEKSEELPLFGDSGDEGDYAGSFLDEIEQDERDAEEAIKNINKRGPLSRDEVSQIVDQATADFVEVWTTKKLPFREATAWSVWKKGKRKQVRTQLVNQAKREVVRLDKRLAKQKDHIVREVWNKPSEVRRQCAIMEQSVFSRQDHVWEIAVWSRKNAPPRLTHKVRTKRKAPSLHASDEDGIALDSDFEAVPDSLDGFIMDAEDSEAEITTTLQPPFDSAIPKIHHSMRPPTIDSLLGPGSDTSTDQEDQDHAEASQVGVTINDAMEIDGYTTPVQPEPENIKPAAASATPEGTHERPGLSNVIDLTFSSDPETSSNEPAGTEKQGSGVKLEISDFNSSRPERASSQEIERWHWADLQERSDRKRLVMKILKSLSAEEYSNMKTRISTDLPRRFDDEIQRTLGAMYRKENRLPGVSPSDYQMDEKFARLYMCWSYCQQRYWQGELPANAFRSMFSVYSTSKDSWKSDVLCCLQFVRTFFNVHENSISQRDKESGPSYSSDSSTEEPDMQDMPHEKRKRMVWQSTAAKQKRETAAARRQEQELREQELREKMGGDIVANGHGIIINTGKSHKHGFIYINPHIASRMKKHQVEGVQFMWREVVTTGQDSSDMQGCLLAHTMGLGKTMQAITILVTIAEAAKSPDPTISGQIPESLKESRTLIICPASLIMNWKDEFFMWTPQPRKDNVGSIRTTDSELPLTARLAEITKWYERGGVLITSYDMLRLLVLNRATKSRQPPLTEEQHATVSKHLLEGPNIIIADEAHNLKNTDSAISKVASRFRSTSRIALTGSPLANNLQEYFAMIDWVSPGYLGSSLEFRALYKEPIEEGLWVNSTAAECRKARKMLKVLEKEIDPKINRANITVLKGDLKPKVEFVITVPLTPIQEEAYTKYVRHLVSAVGDEIANTRLWSWLNILSLLCNHPRAFLNKLRDQEMSKKPKLPKPIVDAASIARRQSFDACGPGTPATDEEAAEVSEQSAPGDEPVSVLGISSAMVEDQERIFAGVQDTINDPSHSYKVALFLQILKHSEEIGDRVLVFSHSIATLNFLEMLFKERGILYRRLDGKTKMSTRQDLSKEFNKGEYNVFLISTRAGGLGFNLPGANRVVLFDFNFNPAWEEQAVGRAYRIGQEKPVFVYRFVTGGTFEDKVHNKAVYKMQLAYTVVEKKKIQSLADKSRDFLFEPRPVPQQDLNEHNGKDPLVLDKILATRELSEGSHIRSISTTETLQVEANYELNPEEEKEVEALLFDSRERKRDPTAYRARKEAEQQALFRASAAAVQTAASTTVSTTPVPLPPNMRSPQVPPSSTAPVMVVEAHKETSSNDLDNLSRKSPSTATSPKIPPQVPPARSDIHASEVTRSSNGTKSQSPSTPLRLSPPESDSPKARTDPEVAVQNGGTTKLRFHSVPASSAPTVHRRHGGNQEPSGTAPAAFMVGELPSGETTSNDEVDLVGDVPAEGVVNGKPSSSQPVGGFKILKQFTDPMARFASLGLKWEKSK